MISARKALFLGLTITGLSCRAFGREEVSYKPPEPIARLLQTRCYACHGGDRDQFTRFYADHITFPVVVPGNPESSLIVQRLLNDDMPREGAALTPREKADIYDWIRTLPEETPSTMAESSSKRALVDGSSVLSAIRDHLRRTAPKDRKFQRYFTLSNLFNNSAVPDADIQAARAALSRMVNSLSWKKYIVVPKPLDRDQTVFAVDIRDYGWNDPEVWPEIIKAYPYGIAYEHSKDDVLLGLAQDISALSPEALPFVRADWFIASAGRPPLYGTILNLPKTVGELRERVGVDFAKNFAQDKLARAGLIKSGVSSQNRMVERETGKYGDWWESYDFLADDGRSSIAANPLGPDFDGNKFSDRAFEQAGGEAIFELPNHLHGFYLQNGKGVGIDAGPTDIVYDNLKVSGTPAIVPGISCMSCHVRGIIPLQDHVGSAAAHADVDPETRRKIEALFPPAAEMDKLIGEDQNRFVAALQAAIFPFRKGTDGLLEPVRGIVLRFQRDLDAKDASIELGLASPDSLKDKISHDPALERQGLSTLLPDGGSVKRGLWNAAQSGAMSAFQEAATSLGLGPAIVEGVPAFHTTDRVELVFRAKTHKGSRVETRWFNSSGPIKTESFVAEGDVFYHPIVAHPDRGGRWDAGDYRLELWVDGVKAKETAYKIVPDSGPAFRRPTG